MKFEFGQKVVCINNHFNYGQSRLKKGYIYTIEGFYICPCGSNQVTLVEIPDIISMRCKCHRTLIRRQSYYNWRFVPLEFSEIAFELPSEISEELYETNIPNSALQNVIML